MTETLPITVIETPECLSTTQKLMSDEERALRLDFLASNPTTGDIVPGTGGARKPRWGLEGRGKRGGARAIYFYHGIGIPLFALTAFTRNDRADLSLRDRNGFRRPTTHLVEAFERSSP